MSVAAMLAFNYYFPAADGHVHGRRPAELGGAAAFLAVAVIASHLSTRARQKAADASARQRDIEKLYSFSQGLLESAQRDGTGEPHPRANRGRI